MAQGRNTFNIGADLAGLDGYMDELDDNAEAAARPASQAAIQVLYDHVKRNVAGMGKVSGNLDRSIYQVFSKTQSKPGVAVYQAGWNAKKAPHGHLLEWGWLQRYVYRPDGMGPVVREGMEGKPKPGRKASRAEKDAYWLTLPTPKQVPGHAFVRSAEASFELAYQAAEAELIRRIKGAK